MAVFYGGDSDCGVVLDSFSDGVECVFVILFVEGAKEAPYAGA